jgi:shikimate dehydrogenase
MHNAALAAVGLGDWRYQLLPVPPAVFAETVAGLPGAGFRGANVTIPHKAQALAIATRPTERATAIGAANTLTFEPDGAIVADNTDAPAILDALPFAISGRTALVLGAGGSARAAAWALAGAGARQVVIWNRTHDRARALADDLGLAAAGPGAPLPDADVIINCTAVGLRGEDPFAALPLSRERLGAAGCVVDLVYAPSGTTLVAAARAAGVATVDGLEILVGQGALSFERFTGRSAPVPVMRDAVRA